MADLTHHERTANAQSAYAHQHSRSDQVRAQAARLIENVVRNTAGRKEIEVYLAIGSVCPFTSKWDLAIWIEETHRLCAEFKVQSR